MRTNASSGNRLTCLSTLITFCVAAALPANAVAENNADSAQYANISDSECTRLFNDSTLNEQNITRRMTCHAQSVDRINWLVKQLQSERSTLTSQLREDDPQLLEYKQNLINYKKTIDRLEQRTNDLATLSDALRVQRDEYRKRLLTVIQEGEARDQSRQLDDRLFSNFSKSYVSLSEENSELRRLLDEQKHKLTGNQSEISKQQSIIQQLQTELSSSTEQVDATQQSNQLITEELQQKNEELEDVKQRLLDTSVAGHKQQEKFLQLTRELALSSEAQKQSLKEHQEFSKNSSRQIDELQSEIQALEQENKTLADTVVDMQAQHDEKIQQAKLTETNLSTDKERLSGQLEQTKTQLALMDTQQSELMQQVESSQTQLQNFNASNVELLQNIEKIEEENTKLNSELDDIEGQLRNTEAQLTDAQEQQQSLQEQLILANDENEELNNTIKAREQAFASLQLKSDTTLEQHKADTLDKQQIIKDLEEKNANLDATTRQLAADLQEQESAFASALAHSKAEMAATIDNQAELNQQYKDSTNALKERLTTRNQRIAEFQIQHIQLGKQFKALQLDSETSKADSSNQLHTLEQRITELETDATKLNDELTAATNLATDYREQLASNSETSANEIASLEAAADKDKQSIEQLTAQASELEEKLATALNKMASNEAALAAIEESKLQIEQTNEETFNRFKVQAVADQQNVAQLEEQLVTKQAHIDEMETKLSIVGEEKNKLTLQVTALDTDVSNLNELLQESQSNLATSLEQLRKELHTSDERLASKKNALAELMEEKQASLDAQANHEKASTLLSESIKSKLSAAGLLDANVELQANQTIAISVGSNTLFRAGSSQLTEEGSNVLTTVGNSIADLEDRKIVVEGHSDNTPLGARLEQRFGDNWGLSMARAVSTANFLTRQAGIAANLLSVSGLGDTDPIADNTTVEGRRMNRRVEILLVDDRTR